MAGPSPAMTERASCRIRGAAARAKAAETARTEVLDSVTLVLYVFGMFGNCAWSRAC